MKTTFNKNAAYRQGTLVGCAVVVDTTEGTGNDFEALYGPGGCLTKNGFDPCGVYSVIKDGVIQGARMIKVEENKTGRTLDSHPGRFLVIREPS